MPDGVVQWFDAPSARATIVRGNRVFPATAADVEPAARRPGARVHFDIRRDNGTERAVNVRLRRGTRVSPHQHRFGTLAGARRPYAKGPAPFTRAIPERGRALAARPLEVASVWVDALRRRDLDTALGLYAPDAVVHTEEGEQVSGRRRLSAYLEASALFGAAHHAEVRGDDDAVVVTWPTDSLEVRLRIEHGLITEQRIGPAPAPRTAQAESTAGPVDITIATKGDVHDSEVTYAVERLRAVLRTIEEPVLFARLKLTRASDPARDRPAIAQVTLDVNGDAIRAQVAARELREAADLLQGRLRDQLQHRSEHLEALRTQVPVAEPGRWRRGALTAPRPDHFPRPEEERQLVRQKTFATTELTPDEAAFDMEMLDYRFYLFRDLATGEDALLERRDDGSYHLTRLQPTDVDPVPASITLTTDDRPAPRLTIEDAIERLDTSGEPYVFFADAATGRGNVVYRRYDGHYGLIAPAD